MALTVRSRLCSRSAAAGLTRADAVRTAAAAVAVTVVAVVTAALSTSISRVRARDRCGARCAQRWWWSRSRSRWSYSRRSTTARRTRAPHIHTRRVCVYGGGVRAFVCRAFRRPCLSRTRPRRAHCRAACQTAPLQLVPRPRRRPRIGSRRPGRFRCHARVTPLAADEEARTPRGVAVAARTCERGAERAAFSHGTPARTTPMPLARRAARPGAPRGADDGAARACRMADAANTAATRRLRCDERCANFERRAHSAP